MRIIFVWVLLILNLPSWAQKSKISGKVTDAANNGIYSQIIVNNGFLKFVSDQKGNYEIELESGKYYSITFKSFGYISQSIDLYLKPNSQETLNVKLDYKYKNTKVVEVQAEKDRYEAGTIRLDASEVANIPTAIGGVEAMIKQFVGSQNEMTSQYNVRGGNYDENLVYINDFEVYRPYLVRSGQQEGLSIINPDLVRSLRFSAGGFQAKYRDKMSSVLDIEYKKPKKFGGSVTLSLLGAGLHLEGISKNQKSYYLVGLRQKSNQYFLQSQPTVGVYNPSFTDMQMLVHHDFNDQWGMEVFGNYAINKFHFIPQEQSVAFGTFDQALGVDLFYEGSEQDKFNSAFAGLSTIYRPSDRTQLKLLASHYRTVETESFDILSNYYIGQVSSDPSDENYGKIVVALGAGEVHDYARNNLNIDVSNFRFKGFTDLENHFLQYGLEYSFTYIDDYLDEWTRRDSAGYNQPFDPREPLFFNIIQAKNKLNYSTISAFIQDNVVLANNAITLNYGLRTTYQGMNEEWLFSPRAQISYKVPDNSTSKDLVLRASGGLYSQPNFYRELRDRNGRINPALRAQKSTQFLAGVDYNFRTGNRPFKYTSEFYYKDMWDIIPYEFDNIRIRYFGKNNSNAYAYGWENRIYGEFVPGIESWLSCNFMKTEENLTDDSYRDRDGNVQYPGYIPRPTDSRVSFNLFFQDYLRNNPNYKVHMNLMYSTGLPTGPPDAQRYTDTYRLPDYKRIDLGFSGLLLDKNRKVKPYYSMFNKLESIWLSLEVFNVIGNRNTLSYAWLSDNQSDRLYYVPNQLTNRLVNLRIITKF